MENYFDIQPKQGVEDPVYPTDYIFKQKIDIKDGSNQYLLSEITNKVNTVEQFQTDDIEFEIDKNDHTLSCVMGLPGSTPNDSNPKLYSNLVGSVFPDSLLKIGVANIYKNGQHKPEDFGNYWFIDQINVDVKSKIKYIINNGLNRVRTSIVNTGNSFKWNIGDSLVLIIQDSNYYQVNFLYNSTIAYTQTVQQKTWVWKFTTNSNAIILADDHNNEILQITNETPDSQSSGLVLSKQVFDLSLLLN